MFDSIPPSAWRNLEADSAAYASAFAARFGPSARMPLVESVEIGNEPGNYSDAQYSSLLHSVAPRLRAADPKLRIATCNLTTGPSTAYAKSVAILTADPAILPALDVLTLHTYAQAEPYPTWPAILPGGPFDQLPDRRCQPCPIARPQRPWQGHLVLPSLVTTPPPKNPIPNGIRPLGRRLRSPTGSISRAVRAGLRLPSRRSRLYLFLRRPRRTQTPFLIRHHPKPENPKPSYYALAHLQSTLWRSPVSPALSPRPPADYSPTNSLPRTPRPIESSSPGCPPETDAPPPSPSIYRPARTSSALSACLWTTTRPPICRSPPPPPSRSVNRRSTCSWHQIRSDNRPN